jgi:hypothetical protein
MKSKLLVSTIVTTILIISLINLVSAVRLDTGTILNTSESNSSMTFSVPIDVDRAVVESTQITLTNIVCSNGVTSSLFGILLILIEIVFLIVFWVVQQQQERGIA